MIGKINLLLLLTVATTSVFAQSICPPIDGTGTEAKYHLAVGAGPTFLYGDLDKPHVSGLAVYLAGDYTIMRGIDIGLEVQGGTLEAIADHIDEWFVKNSYRAGGIMVKVYPFKLFSEKSRQTQSFGHTLKESFYLGAGVLGVINNYDSLSIYRDLNNPNTYGSIAEWDVNGDPIFEDQTHSITLPTLNVGFALPLIRKRNSKAYWSLMVNGQFNYANNDLLDGYVPLDDQMERVNMVNDFYSFYTLGVRYSF